MNVSSQPPVCDVHGHFLPLSALPLLDVGPVRVTVGEVRGNPDSLVLNGMPLGATAGELSSVDYILQQMETAGVERRVLSPPPFTFRYWADVEMGVELCRRLNDGLAEAVASHPQRLVGLCTVPLQDTAAAIAELERATRELGLSGVAVGTVVRDGNLSDERLLDFFAAVADAGLPVLVHPDFVPNRRLADYYLLNLVGMPVETATAMANMIFSGMLDQLPHLRLCFSHGGGVAPYLFGRWTRGWQVRPECRDRIRRPPEEYLRLVYCDTITHSSLSLSFLIRLIGEHRVLLGTDHPFDVQDPDPRGTLAAAPGIGPEERHWVERRAPEQWLRGASA
ncbi:MAG: amidohydrolase family protein [Dehalococcoidia bacterium]